MGSDVATSDDVVWLSKKELSWWCVRSCDMIRMVYRSLKNGSRMTDELLIQRVLLVLEDVLFFPLYSFSCTAKATYDFETASTIVLS
jgi:hypothetical protein